MHCKSLWIKASDKCKYILMNDKTSTIKAGTRIKNVNRVRVDFKLHAHKRPDRLIQTNLCASFRISKILPVRSWTHTSGRRCRCGAPEELCRGGNPWQCDFHFCLSTKSRCQEPSPPQPQTSHPNALQLPSSCARTLWGERERSSAFPKQVGVVWFDPWRWSKPLYWIFSTLSGTIR